MITFCSAQPERDPNHHVIPVNQKPPLKAGMVMVTGYGDVYLSIPESGGMNCMDLRSNYLCTHGQGNNGWGLWEDRELIDKVKIFESLDEYYRWKFKQ